MSERIIYLKGYPTRGDIFVLPQQKTRAFKPLIGRTLLTLGLVSTFLFISPFVLIEAKWRLGGTEYLQSSKGTDSVSQFEQVIQKSDIELLNPVNPQFSLVIPKIGVNAVILPNVPAGNEEEYRSALRQGVAHAAGSYFPGQKGTIYLFGHSTDYIWNISKFNAVFFLLNNLSPGDSINLFYKGKCYTYRVTDKQIVSGDELSLLRPDSGLEKLVLQTCWPPGTTLKRLVVTANPLSI